MVSGPYLMQLYYNRFALDAYARGIAGIGPEMSCGHGPATRTRIGTMSTAVAIYSQIKRDLSDNYPAVGTSHGITVLIINICRSSGPSMGIYVGPLPAQLAQNGLRAEMLVSSSESRCRIQSLSPPREPIRHNGPQPWEHSKESWDGKLRVRVVQEVCSWRLNFREVKRYLIYLMEM